MYRYDVLPEVRYTEAVQSYAAALNNSEEKFSGIALVDSFLEVEQALFVLPGVSEDQKTEVTFRLAADGEQVAERRGIKGAADRMRYFQGRIIDALAIRNGEYPVVGIHEDHGEQHGAPESYTQHFRTRDGRIVLGPMHSKREVIGSRGGIIEVPLGLPTDLYQRTLRLRLRQTVLPIKPL